MTDILLHGTEINRGAFQFPRRLLTTVVAVVLWTIPAWLLSTGLCTGIDSRLGYWLVKLCLLALPAILAYAAVVCVHMCIVGGRLTGLRGFLVGALHGVTVVLAAVAFGGASLQVVLDGLWICIYL